MTRAARKAGWVGPQQPLWQARYYDRVIRYPHEFFKLSQHIEDNVQAWEQDDYFFPIPSGQTCFKLLPPAREATSTKTDLSIGSNTYIAFKEWKLSVKQDIPAVVAAYWKRKGRGPKDQVSWPTWLTRWLMHHANDT